MGWIGVDLFFVLSGFLITKILLEARAKSNRLFVYATRRILRIAPLYFLFIVLVLLLSSMAPASGRPNVPWWSYLVFLQNWWFGLRYERLGIADVTWSLAIEEQFYVVWPTLVWRLRRRTLRATLLAIIVMAPVLRVLLASYFDHNAVYFWTPCRIDVLALGALTFLVWEGDAAGVRNAVARAAVPLVSIGIVAGLLGWLDRTWLPFQAIGYTFVGCMFSSLLLAVRAGTWPRVLRVLCARPLAWLGRVSFGVYLLHQLAITFAHPNVVRHFGPLGRSVASTMVFLVTGTGLTLALAWVSWELWERPWLRLKDRLAPIGGAVRQPG